MHVLIASSSAFRRDYYQKTLQALGHEVSLAQGGVDCIEQVASRRPDVLMLEAPLLWGGSDGVLDLLQGPQKEAPMRVIVIAIGSGHIDWFQLSRYRVEDVLFRLPNAHELQRSIQNLPRPPALPTGMPAVNPA